MLYSAIQASSSAVQAASTFLDVISNNVSNADTPGYKTGQVTFQDVLYTGLRPGAVTNAGTTSPAGTQLGNGVQVDTISGLFTQGGLTTGTGTFDLAIQGNGFFRVQLPDGSTGYTRAGNFTLDNTRTLVSPDGYRLEGGIQVPAGTSGIQVNPDGTVFANVGGTQRRVGQLQLSSFVNPGGLVRVGNNTFTATAGAGAPNTGAPNTGGRGSVTVGNLEQSNVDLAGELVNLIIAQQT
ncbi:MAG: flagellar hook-basal body complex protein, partial [Gemmataceae bacterium]|nr:flagellar hook-basal body complex protein [Gemmataceae bacterium]